MVIEESIENRFRKHPEFSINGRTSLDDELVYMITSDQELDRLIKTDVDRNIDPCSIYIQIIIKLCLL
jgi:hypothetical protein